VQYSRPPLRGGESGGVNNVQGVRPYINLRSGGILSNNGMYRLADAANRDEVATC